MEYYDVICVGGGGAGIMAAVAAAEAGARVAVISKEPVGYGNTRMAVGLTACAGLPGDTREAFVEDILSAGGYLNDRVLVETLVDDSPAAMAKLEGFGHTFIRDGEGRLSPGVIHRAGYHSRARTLQSSGAGVGLAQSLRALMEKYGIGLFEDTFVLGLLKEEDTVRGVHLLALAKGEEQVLACGAVVLATGGAGWLFYPQTSNARTSTGDGYALAFNAGAELIDMEQIQALPFAVTHPEAYRGIFCGEPAVAGPAGKIINGRGEVVLNGGINRLDRASVVCRMSADITSGAVAPHGGLILDLRPNLALENGRQMRDNLRSTGIFNVVLPAYGRKAFNWEEPWEVMPTIHFFMGGVRADKDGRTGIPGLYAAGEAQGGVHGANRLGSVALTEIFVFGLRAGCAAAGYAKNIAGAPRLKVLPGAAELFGRRGSVRPVTLVRQLQKLLWKSAGLVRNKSLLQEALRGIGEIEDKAQSVSISPERVYNTEIADYLELQFMLVTARLVLQAALLREESRGAHLRSDFPENGGEAWRKNIVLWRAENGDISYRLDVSRA